jgi:hypothetical protein
MIAQFLHLGIYARHNEFDQIVYDVYAMGKLVRTCKKKGTALLTLAEELDKQIGER